MAIFVAKKVLMRFYKVTDWQYFASVNIHIYMNYLISNCDCNICDIPNISIKANVPYKVEDVENKICCCVANNAEPLYVNFYESYSHFATSNYKNLTCFEWKSDRYLFLTFHNFEGCDLRSFEFSGKQISVMCSKNIVVNMGEKQLVNMNVKDIKFSHYETDKDNCYIFFVGKRNFLVAFNKDKLLWADYYDEYNSDKEERQILKHLNDGLNQGKVLSVKAGETETYLVYIDDYEMNLKPDFIALIFMDCVVAGNFKYCVNLVEKSLGFDEKMAKQFFPEFDSYFPLNSTTIALIKKNALVGICEFEIVDDKIVNIIVN